ncbi:YezD family protein [Paenibacillus hodogayensis]|uniref:YezD family protein n=1 Tax=Paenibacillus hodogayensis TaxID=279208 RepID=A0ABV5VWP1_9BACL
MSTPVQLDDIWAERILGSIAGLEYGSVQIIVHDGKIVQIERTERKRFDTPAGKPAQPERPRTNAQRDADGQVAQWKKRKG